MRLALLLAATLATLAPAGAARAEPALRYISIGTDALPAVRALAAHDGARFDEIEADDDVAVVELDARELEPLSEQMHAQFHRCGGYMVHATREDALASLAPRVAPAVHVDDTIDHAAEVEAVLPRLDKARILQTIRELSAMPNRYYQSESGAAASAWLRDRWRSFTTRPDVTVELVDHGYAQKSVVLTIPGSTHPEQVVVIGGHLDSIAFGGTRSNAPGADDDASGIATLTEVVRVLLAADYHPARTVQFIAYAAEEVGLRGSLSIARDYKKRGVDVVGVLQLDMTNYQGSDRDIWLMNDFTSPAQNAFLVKLIERYVGATWGWDKCGYACSDHAAWDRAGYPASMPFESRFRDHNKSIHSKKDTLEVSNNNADHALKFARLAASFAIERGKGRLGSATAAQAAPEAPASRWPWWALGLGLLAGGLGLARRSSGADPTTRP